MKHTFAHISGITFRLATIIILLCPASLLASSKCGENQNCTNSAKDDRFDFRGQSSFMMLSPGDTARIKIILYSNNDVRIALCSEAVQQGAELRIIRAIREYSRSIDRIEIRTEEEPVYKLNRSGQKIILIENDKPKLGIYGEKLYVIDHYQKTERTDTIWKTARNIREEALYDSRKPGSKPFFESSINKTTSVIIEVTMPENMKPNATLSGECVGVVVGRKFWGSTK